MDQKSIHFCQNSKIQENSSNWTQYTMGNKPSSELASRAILTGQIGRKFSLPGLCRGTLQITISSLLEADWKGAKFRALWTSEIVVDM